MTLEGPAKWDEEKQDSCLIQVFQVVRTAALAEGAVQSHSYTPSAHLPSMYRWERAEWREQQLCLAHKPLTNGDAKNHTQQQCGITQTF